jgi:hypothetical protein
MKRAIRSVVPVIAVVLAVSALMSLQSALAPLQEQRLLGDLEQAAQGGIPARWSDHDLVCFGTMVESCGFREIAKAAGHTIATGHGCCAFPTNVMDSDGGPVGPTFFMIGLVRRDDLACYTMHRAVLEARKPGCFKASGLKVTKKNDEHYLIAEREP